MPRPWTVLPHTPLEKLQPNLWSVEASLPQGPLRRRMGIARLADGRVLFLNAVALDEPAMREIEAWGEPAFALAGNAYHRIDLGSFRERYPKLKVLCAPGARKRIAEIVQPDGWLELLPAEAGVRVEDVAGSKMGDAVAVCTSGHEATLCFPGDVLVNALPARGLAGLILKLAGFIGDLRVPPLIKWIGVRDRRALREHLLRLADTPGLQRIFTCHGPVISVDPVGALRRAAEGIRGR